MRGGFTAQLCTVYGTRCGSPSCPPPFRERSHDSSTQVRERPLAVAIQATNGYLLLGKNLPSGNARVIINGLLFINPIFLNHVGTRLSRERR